jgi:hypothetical protein
VVDFRFCRVCGDYVDIEDESDGMCPECQKANLVDVKCKECKREFKVEEPEFYEDYFHVKCDCGNIFTYPPEEEI